MKSTGIVRPVDQFGRVVLPKELRKNLGIEDGAFMEIFVDGSKIVLRKYQPGSFTADEFQEALNLVCQDTGKDPVKYLEKVKGESL